VIDSEILAQIAIFLAKPISKLLLVSQKNLQDDQKTLYIKEINPKLRLRGFSSNNREIKTKNFKIFFYLIFTGS
jgi:hypothetical protein